MNSVKKLTNKFEDTVESFASPMKPYLPGIARFLMIVTFLEDSVRIMTQWSDQVYYLTRHRGFPSTLAQLFLITNVIVMLVCSFLAVTRRHTETAVSGLFGVMISQALGYGLYLALDFLLRTLSVVGGLCMLLAESWSTNNRRKVFAGLPSMNEQSKGIYLQLFGRILLVCLFFSFILNGEFSFVRMVIASIALMGSVLVVLGFKAKYTAWMLIAFLSISNIVLNNWWSLHHAHPRRDFLKFEFFQTLSVVGGFLLLANIGAGGLSMDEQKKNF